MAEDDGGDVGDAGVVEVGEPLVRGNSASWTSQIRRRASRSSQSAVSTLANFLIAVVILM